MPGPVLDAADTNWNMNGKWLFQRDYNLSKRQLYKCYIMV